MHHLELPRLLSDHTRPVGGGLDSPQLVCCVDGLPGFHWYASGDGRTVGALAAEVAWSDRAIAEARTAGLLGHMRVAMERRESRERGTVHAVGTGETWGNVVCMRGALRVCYLHARSAHGHVRVALSSRTVARRASAHMAAAGGAGHASRCIFLWWWCSLSFVIISPIRRLGRLPGLTDGQLTAVPSGWCGALLRRRRRGEAAADRGCCRAYGFWPDQVLLFSAVGLLSDSFNRWSSDRNRGATHDRLFCRFLAAKAPGTIECCGSRLLAAGRRKAGLSATNGLNEGAGSSRVGSACWLWCSARRTGGFGCCFRGKTERILRDDC
ncbi:histidine ammonia-lyase [Striga asiatica]|uniref:Histidine ammonia-lyase n=1 Tax=Striga asiatica TaxID=4170 RepID=A0A5A7PWH1_STRAF|nr:histidine ammonia-lyase [Striga asiatica]